MEKTRHRADHDGGGCRPLTWLLAGALAAALPALAQPEPPIGEQVSLRVGFVILAGGRPIGIETLASANDAGARQVISALQHRPYDLSPFTEERTLVLDPANQGLASYRRQRIASGVSTQVQAGLRQGLFWILRERPPLLPDFRDGLAACDDALIFDGRSVLPYEVLANRLGRTELPAEFCYFDGSVVGRLKVTDQASTARGRVIQIDRPEPVVMTLSASPPGLLLEVEWIDRSLKWTQTDSLPVLYDPIAPEMPAGLRVQLFVTRTYDNWLLQGTLVQPAGDGPWPAVVMAGELEAEPPDRGGLFAELAAALAGEGIAAVYYSPRGVLPSDGSFRTATWIQHSRDLEAVVRQAASLPGIDGQRLALLGHGGGGLLAAAAAAGLKELRGCVFLGSPATRPFPDLAEENLRSLAEERGWVSERLAGELEAQRLVLELADRAFGEWVPVNGAPYPVLPTREAILMKPEEIYTALRLPCLLAYGADDRLVPPGHGNSLRRLLGSAGCEVQFVPLRKLDHSFGTPSRLSDANPHRQRITVSRQLTAALIPWLKRQFAAVHSATRPPD